MKMTCDGGPIPWRTALREAIGAVDARCVFCWFLPQTFDCVIAVKDRRYEPTSLAGQPVEVDTTITVTFAL
jgi:hypothetical protein